MEFHAGDCGFVCKGIGVPVQDPDEPDALPVSDAVIVPAEKSPELSLNTIVLPVLASVALDVTVNVAPSAFAVPDIPLPDVAPSAK